MRWTLVVGLVLWRGGALLAGGYLAYQALRVILNFTDAQLEAAVAVFLTGLVMVFVSIVVEQIQDAGKGRGQIQ